MLANFIERQESNKIIFRRCKQDLLGFGQRPLPLVLEINSGLFYVVFQSA